MKNTIIEVTTKVKEENYREEKERILVNQNNKEEVIAFLKTLEPYEYFKTVVEGDTKIALIYLEGRLGQSVMNDVIELTKYVRVVNDHVVVGERWFKIF